MRQTFYPMSQQAEFLSALFSRKDGAFMELRLLPEPEGNGAVSRFYESIDQLIEALPKTVEQQNGNGVFVGVCPRSQHDGKKTSVKQVCCLWIDLDAKDFTGGKEEAWQRLCEFPLRPTMITDSGNGYHAYWCLNEPILIQGKPDIHRMEGFNRRLAALLNGDFQSVELARVLRLPGSWNLKDAACPLPVKICEVEPNRRYSLSAFDWLPESERQQPPTNGKANGASAVNPALSAAIEQIRAKADIVAIIGKRISLDSNYKARCPFHPDENPSFSVNPQGRYFYCFGCGVGGDVFKFLQLSEEKSFMEAVSQLAKETDVALPDSSKPEVKAVYAARFEELVDLVEHQGEVQFLVKDGDKLLIVPEVQKGDVLYVPPPKVPWLLPRGEEVLRCYETDTDARLFDDLVAYHRGISELPTDDHYILLAAWDFQTYLLDSMRYSGYIWLFSVAGRGKTRTGAGMIHVSYRGLHVESLREAYLIRLPDYFGGALFIDVLDLWKAAQRNGAEDVLLNRFQKSAESIRVNPDRPKFEDLTYYVPFGATVIATNFGVPEQLESRAIQITMPDTSKMFESDVTPEAAQPLKERLVAFRARHLGESLPDIPKPALGRLGDIARPFFQVIRLVRPEREEALLRLVQRVGEERLIERADSVDAEIIKAVLESGGGVHNGKLSVQRVGDAYNAGKSEKEKLNNRRVGSRLKAIGFEKDRMNDGTAGIVWDERKLERFCQAYGLQRSETSVSRSKRDAPYLPKDSSAQYQNDERDL